ncbi:hypothetical protein [Salipaludibacillus sp. CF4.18]|uniref:hypothetical protein n=1 Tax=Salipaludibacillus sp. CF4.18 TaxID=3373081 RepID=UPI003EE47843
MKSYYEYDVEHDSIIDSVFPYPMREYRIYYEEEDLIRKKVLDATYLDPKYSKLKVVETKLKFGKKIRLYYSISGELIDFEAKGGWVVDHNARKIFPKYRKYINMWSHLVTPFI